MNKLTNAALVLMFSSQAFADVQRIDINRKITNISVYSNRVIIKFSPSFEFSQVCKQGAGSYVVIDTTDGANNQIVSSVLAAAAQKNYVGFGVSDCAFDNPKVYRVDVAY